MFIRVSVILSEANLYVDARGISLGYKAEGAEVNGSRVGT